MAALFAEKGDGEFEDSGGLRLKALSARCLTVVASEVGVGECLVYDRTAVTRTLPRTNADKKNEKV